MQRLDRDKWVGCQGDQGGSPRTSCLEGIQVLGSRHLAQLGVSGPQEFCLREGLWARCHLAAVSMAQPDSGREGLTGKGPRGSVRNLGWTFAFIFTHSSAFGCVALTPP